MSHLVPDFVLNPVLRQARRFSRPNTTSDFEQHARQQTDLNSSNETVTSDIIEPVGTSDALEPRAGEILRTGPRSTPSSLKENESLGKTRKETDYPGLRQRLGEHIWRHCGRALTLGVANPKCPKIRLWV
jgi:hypothetical protein